MCLAITVLNKVILMYQYQYLEFLNGFILNPTGCMVVEIYTVVMTTNYLQ